MSGPGDRAAMRGGDVHTMTAAVLTAHGGPEVLEVRHDVPVPTPGPGQVLVRVTAAAVNTTDVWSREGAYGRPGDPDAVVGWRGVPLAFPRVQGGDAVGHVVGPDGDDGRRVLLDPARYDAAGTGVEAVMGSELDGGFAQYVAVDEAFAHDVGGSPLSDVELACLPIAYGTAAGMLARAEVAAGETVVVTGASGGVGLGLVQLAVARGARVVAVTTADGAGTVRAAGAAAVVDRRAGPLADAVRAAAGGEVEVVADVVGAPTLTALLDLLATGGRFVTCGAVAGAVVELDLRQLYLRSRRLVGSTMHTAAQFATLVEEAVAGRVAPHVAQTYPLSDIATAQEDLRAEGRTGKLVLLP